MATFDLLQRSAAPLVRRLEAASEAQLREITAALARAAVEWTHLSALIISRALAHLDGSPRADPELQSEVQNLAQQLDEDYFTLREPYEQRDEPAFAEPKVRLAFSEARAASAVAAALGEDKRQSAAETAYEALAAIGGAEYLVAIADKVIGQR